MTDDAADDDDERLKSLRAVWLSMPDEDPPERGLADLMAAARMKADEMAAKAEPAAPSLWQRFLELMRRPPVLALATVMVLIGGAALVGRRGDKMESAPTVAPTQTAPESMTTGAPPLERADNARAPASEPAAAPAQGSAIAIPAEESIAPRGGENGDAEATKGVVGGAAVQTKATGNKAAPAPKRHANNAVQTAAPVEQKQEPARRAPLALDAVDQTTAVDDGDLETEAAAKKTRGAPAPATTDEPAIGKASSAPQTKPAPFSASQLHAVARKEAARKDCAAARQLVQKIAAADPGYYKANVVHDPALAVCTNSN